MTCTNPKCRCEPPGYPCTHPEMRPTKWDQPKPAPSKYMGCSHSYICPVCGWGQGCWPDPCYPMRDTDQEYAEIPIYRDMFTRLGLEGKNRC